MSISALLIDLQKNWSFFAPPVRNETTVAYMTAKTRLHIAASSGWDMK